MTKYICINGHENHLPGQYLGPAAPKHHIRFDGRDQGAIHECATKGCSAEAEPLQGVENR